MAPNLKEPSPEESWVGARVRVRARVRARVGVRLMVRVRVRARARARVRLGFGSPAQSCCGVRRNSKTRSSSRSYLVRVKGG